MSFVAAGALGATLWPILVAAADHDGGAASAALRQSILPAALLSLVLLVAVRHAQRWRGRALQLARHVAEVRSERRACEELVPAADDSPEWAALIREISGACHDLKSQRGLVRRLEAEVARKVSARTDVLERQLGTMRHKAERDALTGLGNRGSFDRLYPALVDKARRSGVDLCVTMIDVDYFKQLNDTLGHAAGDDLLKKIGQLVRGAVREKDEAFRYGGDEFVLVFWGTGAQSGRATAERLSRLVEDLCRPFRLPNAPRLTCGVASLADNPAAGASDLLRLADEDLYRLKKARKSARAA